MSAAQISCKTPEHYTPGTYIATARYVLGGIDLDPASSAEANDTVQAQTYYTAADDGLDLPWFGRVFVNPPGDKSGKLVKAFWHRACLHALNGGAVLWVGFNIEQLQSLQNGLQPLPNGNRCPRPIHYPRVIPSSRIRWVPTKAAQAKFDAENCKREAAGLRKTTNSPPHGNYICLLGGDSAMLSRFRARFREFGDYVAATRYRAERDLESEILATLRTAGPAGSKKELAFRVRARRSNVISTVNRLVGQGAVLIDNRNRFTAKAAS